MMSEICVPSVCPCDRNRISTGRVSPLAAAFEEADLRCPLLPETEPSGLRVCESCKSCLLWSGPGEKRTRGRCPGNECWREDMGKSAIYVRWSLVRCRGCFLSGQSATQVRRRSLRRSQCAVCNQGGGAVPAKNIADWVSTTKVGRHQRAVAQSILRPRDWIASGLGESGLPKPRSLDPHRTFVVALSLYIHTIHRCAASVPSHPIAL